MQLRSICVFRVRFFFAPFVKNFVPFVVKKKETTKNTKAGTKFAKGICV